MRKLLNTLYILSPDNYLSLENENVVVQQKGNVLGRFPLHTLESIISFSYAGASPALMGACAERNIGLAFFSPKGKFLARISSLSNSNVLLRKKQEQIADNEEESICIVKYMLVGKIFNERWTIERTKRDNAFRVDIEKLKYASQNLKSSINDIMSAKNFDSLRGFEGKASTYYFDVFDEMILNQKEYFSFTTRNKRPPLDKVNALLSFAYVILSNDCANALESVGLDPYFGFMHTLRPGRKSLALDLVEEFRAPIADRFVISLINTNKIGKDDFELEKDGAVLLNQSGKKKFFNNWQQHKKERITHPFLQEKIEWGLVPYVQALLLARTLRGDLEEYPAFLWK